MINKLSVENFIKLIDTPMSRINKNFAEIIGCNTVTEAKNFKNIFSTISSRTITKTDLINIKKYVEIKFDKIYFDVRRQTNYLKKCSKWGNYCPEYTLFFYKIYRLTINNQTIQFLEILESEILGYHARGNITQNSEKCITKTYEYKNCVITESYIFFKNKKYLIEKIIEKDGTTYHYKNKTDFQAFSELSKKIILEKELKTQKQLAKKSEKQNKKPVQIFMKDLHNTHKWCLEGMKKFCEILNISDGELNTNICSIFKKANYEDRQYLLKHYDKEIKTFMRIYA